MRRTSITPIAILGTLTALILLAGPAAAQTTDLNYGWDAPTTGTAVVHYVVQHSVNGGTWTQIATSSTNSYTLTATTGDSHQIRVAGVDAEDRMGPFSEPSDPFAPDAGPPGVPGKPIIF